MKRLQIFSTAALTACLALPAAAQVDVEVGGTEVQVGGGQGVQVDTPAARTQSRPEAIQTPRNGGDVRGDQEWQSDGRLPTAALANWLLIDQRNTQQLAQFGLQRSKDPGVRKLAETVLQDHGDFAKRLQTFAQARPTAPAERAEANAEQRQTIRDQREENRDAVREQRERNGDLRRAADGVRRPLERLADRVEDGVERVAEGAQDAAEATREAIDNNLGDDRDRRVNRRGPNRGGLGQVAVKLHGEIAAKTADMARRDLEQRDGYEFDAAFVGIMEAAHMQHQATLEVMTQYASPELRPALDDALATIKQHRQMAGQVMQNLQPQR